jgi:hypothetical protein
MARAQEKKEKNIEFFFFAKVGGEKLGKQNWRKCRQRRQKKNLRVRTRFWAAKEERKQKKKYCPNRVGPN